MGDINADAGQAEGLEQPYGVNRPKGISANAARQPADSSAFQPQLEYYRQTHYHNHPNASSFGQRPFDLSTLAGALPQSHDGSPYPAMYHGHPHAGRGVPFDPAMMARAQQQHYQGPYGSLPHQQTMLSRQPMPIGVQGQYPQFDPYAFGSNAAQMQSLDPRLSQNNSYNMGPQMHGDLSQTSRRASEPGPIPSFPRGPPRKPKQSGHALWVGNLPPNANVTDLKDHFSRDATNDIQSLFLISKSNCAFVNYRTEAACAAAMHRFHDSRFHGVRLVCRLRRGSTATSSMNNPTVPETLEPPPPTESPDHSISPVPADEPSSPTIVGGGRSITPPPTQQDDPPAEVDSTSRVADKYFIVKSLTAQDLEASVLNGIWATQSHNEQAFNEAFNNTDNVYLIFSANKSGEYFGYARMTSIIAGEPVNLSATSQQSETPSPGAPQSIPTSASATAPRGRIIDDSARGTIFWEADHAEAEESESPIKGEGSMAGNSNWGRQFSVEWMSTARLPFYRTRGLRNPWNANREIKIARDGTELETSVGRRLVQMFHRPPPPGPLAGGMY